MKSREDFDTSTGTSFYSTEGEDIKRYKKYLTTYYFGQLMAASTVPLGLRQAEGAMEDVLALAYSMVELLHKNKFL